MHQPIAPWLETSEKVLLSYLVGQTVAQRLAKVCWGVPRLFHRSLYGPLLPALVGGPLPQGLSPDFVCLGALPIPPGGGPPALGLGLLEAKGTLSLTDPGTQFKDRERINKAFRNQIAPLATALGAGGPWNCGVAVACYDDDLGYGRIAGQLWDPPNPDAQPVLQGGVGALHARYIKAMHLLLSSLEGNIPDRGGGILVWESRSIGFRITIDTAQWEWMSAVVDNRLTGPRLLEYIEDLPEEQELNERQVRNQDGLTLELI
jgi:hypothetical protein